MSTFWSDANRVLYDLCACMCRSLGFSGIHTYQDMYILLGRECVPTKQNTASLIGSAR